MVALVHLLMGAMVGVLLNSPPAVFVVAFFSHYLLDRLPHIDPETYTEKNAPYSWTQLISLISDAVTTILVSLLFFFTAERWAVILLGITSSILPDLLMPLERYSVMSPLRRFHKLAHWNRKYARQWQGYITGLVTPAATAAISTAVLWWMW